MPGALLLLNTCGVFLVILPLFSSLKDPRSTSVPMKTLPEINRINQSLVQKWIAAKRNKEREEAER